MNEVYKKNDIGVLLEQDEISDAEAAFMEGYLAEC